MLTAPSREVQTLHPGDLDQFETSLTAAGFRMRDGDEHHWIGPIHPALLAMTSATEMRINIRDGWPYLHPYLFVRGLGRRVHVSASGNVCLWDEADEGYTSWLTFDAMSARIVDWAADQARGPADLPFDAHLYFGTSDRAAMLLVDLGGLLAEGRIAREDESHGRLRARLSGTTFRVAADGSVPTAWFWRDGVTAPPQTLTAFRELLADDQREDLDRLVGARRADRASLALLLWSEAGTINGIAIRIRGVRGRDPDVDSIEIARTDEAVVRLRGGPDQAQLAVKRVLTFGVGAIGSEIVRLLAQAGVGQLHVVDHELLRPGNLTRHAASGMHVGQPKVQAVRETIQAALPHVRVTTTNSHLWTASEVEHVLRGADLAVEATGNRAYRDFLSRAVAGRVPLIGVALHRRGFIGRITVEVGDAHPVWARNEANGFPDIPPDPERPRGPQWEVGCGSPVNNASPISVAAVAAAAAAEIVDVLGGRVAGDRDIVDVYAGIEDPRFGTPGRIVFAPLP